MNTFWRKPLDSDEITIPRGAITIISQRCKGCEICLTYCPRAVLSLSASFNPKGYHYPQVDQPDACVACCLCQIMCPEFAIFVTELEPV